MARYSACGGHRLEWGRRIARALLPNRSIDTDVLSAGFAGLLSAGHLQR